MKNNYYKVKAQTLKNIANAVRINKGKMDKFNALELIEEILNPEAIDPKVVIPDNTIDNNECLIKEQTVQGLVNAVRTRTETTQKYRLEDLPAIIEELPVEVFNTKIEPLAYANRIDLTSIIIPYGIKEIGMGAFLGCTNLETVVLPEGLEKVDALAFYGCDKLKYNIRGNIRYLGSRDYPYYYCEGLPLNLITRLATTDISLHSDCFIVGAGAFLGCINAKTLDLGSVMYIGDYAFRKCSALQNVNFRGVRTIGKEAFRDCSALTSLEVYDTTTFIGRGAFQGCSKLTNVTLPFVGRTGNANERHCHFGYIFGANDYTENIDYVPHGLNVRITNAKGLGDYAFYGCELSGLLLPGGSAGLDFNYIGKGAFANLACPLTEINGVYYLLNESPGAPWGGAPCVCMGNLSGWAVDYDIIDGCKFVYDLKEYIGDKDIYHLTIPNSVIGISDNVLSNAGLFAYEGYNSISKSTKYTYKPTETAIETYYLGSEENPYLYCLGCEKLDNYNNKDIIIADGCRFIGEQAFMGLKDANVIIPKSVKYIGASAFENANISLLPQEGSTFADYEFTRIGAYAFFKNDVSVDGILNATIKHIGKGAFKYYRPGRNIVLKGTETIDASTFASCDFYTSSNNANIIDLYQTNVTTLSDYMFADCLNPKEIILPDTLERIGNSAFENVTINGGAGEIRIPKGVVSMGANAFKNCKHNSVYYTGTDSDWAMIEFNNAHSSPIRHGGAGAGVTLWIYVPQRGYYFPLNNDINIDKAYKISDYAFYDYRQLSVAHVENYTLSIGESAFENTFIGRVTMSENVLFDVNAELSIAGISLSDLGITIDEDASKIKDYAFYNNYLYDITIPKGCKFIGKKAFNYTNGQIQTLKEVTILAETPPELADDYTFPDSVQRYIVPKGKLSTYQSATRWSKYANKMEEKI